MDRVANSTPMVDLHCWLNSFFVNRDSRFDFPTPESPISTTLNRAVRNLRAPIARAVRSVQVDNAGSGGLADRRSKSLSPSLLEAPGLLARQVTSTLLASWQFRPSATP
ncbi:receptor-type tyrosine-protein phosphatase C [Striga asiatica]|uniref:Receptor-type tyrosine-protein phosphatase C n=1 Tax=Striga asiatica TaxID=4170 RepID=A0A5A7P1E5_STRAF|nr:receptor-type tyrosine-protein phosphatase C [Striga asiatica]